MSTYFRITSTLALAAVLAAGATTAARAQDTSSATRSDTMGYQPAGGQTDTTVSDSGLKSEGAPSDTALRAKPGVQTGPAVGDSGQAASQAGAAGTADTVVCKDGSNAAKQVGCTAHGGIDEAATSAALKARGMAGQPADSASIPADSGQKADSGQTK